MATFDEVRSVFPEAAKLSDEEIVGWAAKRTGMDVQSVAREFGMKTGSERSLPRAAIASGTDDLQGIGYSAIGASADIVSRVIPAAGRVRDWANRRAEANQIESAISGRPEYDDVTEQSLGSLPAWALYQGLKQIPQLGVTAAAMVAAPQVAVPGALARAAAVTPKVAGVGGMGLKAGADFAARRAALEGGRSIGAAAMGGLGVGSTMGLGSMYQESVDAGDPSPFKALAMSPLYGLTETIPTAATLNLLKTGGSFAGNMATRMLKSGAVAGGTGAVAEGLQNEMEMGFNPNLTPEEITNRRINAIAAGGVAEAGFGAAGGIRRPLSDKEPEDLLKRDSAPAQPSAIPLLGEDRQLGLGFPVNPLDAGPYPSGTMPGPAGAQGDMFGTDLRDVGPPATVAPRSAIPTGTTAPAAPTAPSAPPLSPATTAIADNAARGQLDLAQQQTDVATRRAEALQKYGKPLDPADPSKGWTIEGKSVFAQEDIDKVADRLAEIEAKKTPVAREAERAYLETFSGKPEGPELTASKLASATSVFTNSAKSVEEVVSRLDREIARMTALGSTMKTGEFARMERLQEWRSKLTGEPVPTIAPPGSPAATTPAAPTATTPPPARTKGTKAVDPKTAPSEVAVIDPAQYEAQQAAATAAPTAPAATPPAPATETAPVTQPAAAPTTEPVVKRRAKRVVTSTTAPVAAVAEASTDPVDGGMAETNSFTTEPTTPQTDPRKAVLEGAFGPSRAALYVAVQDNPDLAQPANTAELRLAVNRQLPAEEQLTFTEIRRLMAAMTTPEGQAAFTEDVNAAGEELGMTPEQVQELFANTGNATKDLDNTRSEIVTEVLGESGQQIMELYAQGLSQKRIVERLGTGRQQAVSEYFKRMSKPEGRRMLGALLAQSAAKRGLTQRQVADMFDLGGEQQTTAPGEVIDENETLAVERAEERGATQAEDTPLQVEDGESVAESDAPAEGKAPSSAGSAGGSKSYIAADRLMNKINAAESDVEAIQSEIEQSGAKVTKAQELRLAQAKKRLAAAEEEFAKKNASAAAAQTAAKELRKAAVERAKAEKAGAKPEPKSDTKEQPDPEATKAAATAPKKTRAKRQAPVEKPNPLREVLGETTAERAKRLYTEQRADVFPEWDELPELAQTAFTQLISGRANAQRGDQSDVSQLVQDVDRGKYGALPDKFNSAGNNAITGQPTETMTLDELASRNAGVSQMRQNFDRFGLSSLFDFVNEWVIGDADGHNGTLAQTPNGARLELNRELVEADSHSFTAWVASHEVGHAIDIGIDGSPIYSAAPEMGLLVNPKTNKVIPVGKVAKEMHALYENDPVWQAALEYPFDLGKHSEKNRVVVRAELFAQLWAAYTNPKVREALRQDAPETFNFLERVAAHATQRPSPRGRVQARQGKAPAQDGGAQVVQAGQPAATSRRYASKGTAQDLSGLIDRLPKSVQEPTRVAQTNIANAMKKGLFTAAFTEDLADMAEKYLPSVRRYIEAGRAMMRDRASHENRIDRIYAQFDKLPASERGVGERSVNGLIFQMTRENKWGFEPDWLPEGVDRNRAKANIDAAVKARFDRLSPTGQQLIKDVFRHGHESLLQKQQAVTKTINSLSDALLETATGPEERAKIELDRKAQLARFDRLMKIDKARPYAPLKRFGNYIMVAKSQAYLDAEKLARDTKSPKDAKALDAMRADENHLVVSFYETLGEAKAEARKREGRYAYSQGFAKDKSAEVLYGTNDMHLAFGRLRNLMRDEFSAAGSDPAVLKKVQQMLNELHVVTLSESSARQAEQPRTNTAGADRDMMRAFVTQGRADAHFLASLQHNDEVVNSLEAMRQEAKDSSDRDSAVRYLNEFMLRHADSLAYTPRPVQEFLKRATSIWLLSTSPTYYFQQLVQPFVLSMPVMGGNFGYSRTWSALSAAYKDLAPLVKSVRISDRMDFDRAPAAIRDVLQAMADRGKINIGQDFDLGRIESDNSLINTMDRGLRGINEKIESINRAATAIAAYRLYLQKHGADKRDDALRYAERIIHQTHGSYDGFNNPRLMGSLVPGSGVLFQFKKFQIIQLSLLARLFSNSFKNADPKERGIARRALRYTLMHAFALGGMVGLPGASAMMWVASQLFGDEDEPWDTEDQLRRAIGDEFLSNLLLRGAPASMGVDLSGKLGMGNALSIMPFADLSLSRDGYKDALLGLSGPFLGGLAPKAIDGVGLIAKGDYWKGLEQLLPTGLANAAKGVRFGTDGVTMRNGDVVLSPEDVSLIDAAFQAVGMPTTMLTDRQRIQSSLIAYERFYNERTSAIKRDYAQAYRSGDAAATAEALDEWRSLQESRRKNGFTVQPLSSLLRAPREMAKREGNTVGGIEVTKANRGFVEQRVGN